LEQVGVMPLHWMPQPPQLLGSEVMSTQLPPQHRPLVHGELLVQVQAPPAQVSLVR
jgi:hypothetical protein